MINWSAPRPNPKRDRVIMKCIANSKGVYVVPKILKNNPINPATFDVNVGLGANPEQFMIALTKRVEKLTTNKQKMFFTNASDWLEKQPPEYLNRLKSYVKDLITDKNKSKELAIFNKFKRAFFKIAKKNEVDIKRFFTK